MKRKKHHRLICVQIFLAFLLSCSGNGNSPQNVHKSKGPSKEVEIFIQQWKSDSLGCQKLRTKIKAEAIIDSLKLGSSEKTEFISVFGNPNKQDTREGSIILGYYFDAICINEKLMDSADYCIAEFTFMENKLTQRNYICH